MDVEEDYIDLRQLVDEERGRMLDAVQWLCLIDEAEFKKTVADEVKGRIDPVLSQALRHRKLHTRWKAELDVIAKEVKRQLADSESFMARQDYQEWRRRTVRFLEAVEQRQRELLHRSINGRSNHADNENGIAARRSKREYGEVAIHRLIEAHKAEWTRLLAAEYARAGEVLPDGVHQALRDVFGGGPLSAEADGCDPTHAEDMWAQDYFDVVEWTETDEGGEWVLLGSRFDDIESALNKARVRNDMTGSARYRAVQVYEYMRYIEVDGL